MAKTTNNSTSVHKAAIKTSNRDSDHPKSPWLEEYRHCFEMKLRPVTQMFLDEFGRDLMIWARDNDDALAVSQFYNSKGVHEQTYYDWVNKYPDFKMSHEMAMSLLADRREIGAIKKKYDAGMISTMMPAYRKDWKAMAEWRAKIKGEAEGDSGTKIVIMKDFPSSDLVPEKKKRNTDRIGGNE